MKEKSERVSKVCNCVGVVSIIIYMLLKWGGYRFGISFALPRIILATVALTAFSIPCGIAIANDEKIGTSILFMAISIIDIILPAIDLML